jgi:hypothetical protein
MSERTSPGIAVRRIRQDEGEAVVELWDRMCREVVDGGPLRPCGRRNLRRMLEVAAFHRDTFCLVAVRPDGGIAGFAMGHLDAGDGLLPGLVGEAQELYAAGDDVRRRLADAVVARLEAAGAQVIRSTVAADEPDTQRFWTGLGFEADMVVLSRYTDGPCPGCEDRGHPGGDHARCDRAGPAGAASGGEEG